jgi:alkylhydroperoxidase family enzyme
MGANHVAARFAFNDGVDVATAVTFRSGITAIVVAVLLKLQHVPLQIAARHRKVLPAIAALVALQSLCLYAAVARLPVALALAGVLLAPPPWCWLPPCLPALLALLSLAPAQRAAGLTPDDVADLETLLDESGARWGLSAEDKRPIYGRAVHENTLEFGLERMALGVVMPDDAEMPTGAPERTLRARARLLGGGVG